jgi:hypothetical protein
MCHQNKYVCERGREATRRREKESECVYMYVLIYMYVCGVYECVGVCVYV